MSARPASPEVLLRQALATESVYELDDAYHTPQDEEDWEVVWELVQAYNTDGLVSAEAFSRVQGVHKSNLDHGEIELAFEVAGHPGDLYNLEELMAVLQDHQPEQGTQELASEGAFPCFPPLPAGTRHRDDLTYGTSANLSAGRVSGDSRRQPRRLLGTAAAAAAVAPVPESALRRLESKAYTPKDKHAWETLVSVLTGRAALSSQHLSKIRKFRKKDAAKGDSVELTFLVEGCTQPLKGIIKLLEVLLQESPVEQPAEENAADPQAAMRVSSPDELPETKASRGRSSNDSPQKSQARSGPAAAAAGGGDGDEGDGVARVWRSSTKVESRHRPHKLPSAAAAAAGPSGRDLTARNSPEQLWGEAVVDKAQGPRSFPLSGLMRRRSSSTAAGSSRGAAASRQTDTNRLQDATEPTPIMPKASNAAEQSPSQTTMGSANAYGVEPYVYNGKINIFQGIDEQAGAIKKLGELLEAIAAANEEPPGTWEDFLEQAVDLGIITFGDKFGSRTNPKATFVKLVVGPAKDQLHQRQTDLWKEWRARAAAGGSPAPEVAPAAAAEPTAQQPLSSQAASAAAAGPMPAPTGSRAAAAAAGGMSGRSASVPHSAQQLPAPQHEVAQLHPPAPLTAGQEALQLQARLHEQQQREQLAAARQREQLAAARQREQRLQAQLGEAQRQLEAEQQAAQGLRDQLASAQQQAAQQAAQLAAEQQRTQALSAQLTAEQQQTAHLQEQLATTQWAATAARVSADHHHSMWTHWSRLRMNELPELINLRQQVRELQQQGGGGGRGPGRRRGRARGRAGPG